MIGVVRLGEEHEVFRDSVRRALADLGAVPANESGSSVVRAHGWSRVANNLGLFGLCIPKSNGGEGHSYLELAVVLEEMGRVLLRHPYVGTSVLGTTALVRSQASDAAGILPLIARGERTCVLAFGSDGNVQTPMIARQVDGEYEVTGKVEAVIDGCEATDIVVVADADGDTALFLVTAGTAGIRRTPQRSFDLHRSIADLEFSGARARRLTDPGIGEATLRHVFDIGGVSLAAESLGCAQACLELAASHAISRVQFGHAIGAFQAVKHKCANMLLLVESARAATYFAAWQLATDTPDAGLAVGVACETGIKASLDVIDDAIQIHGALGLTWEHPCHRYLRRVKSVQLTTSNWPIGRDRLAMELDL